MNDMSDFEKALRALKPAGQVTRDQLMFQAGRAAAERRGWVWPATTIIATSLAVALAWTFYTRPEPSVVERIVYVEVDKPVVVAKGAEEKKSPTPEEPVITAQAVNEPPYEPLSYKPAMTLNYKPGLTLWEMQSFALKWGVENLPKPPPPALGSTEVASEPQNLSTLMKAWMKEEFGKTWRQ
jgi:hypothetical protein